MNIRIILTLICCVPIVIAAVRIHAINGRDWRPAVIVMALYLVPVLSTIVSIRACAANLAHGSASVQLQSP